MVKLASFMLCVFDHSKANCVLSITAASPNTWKIIVYLFDTYYSYTVNFGSHIPPPPPPTSRSFFKKYLFIYLLIYLFISREIACTQREGAEREESENPKQALCCQSRARCRAWSHLLWDHDLSWNKDSGCGAPGWLSQLGDWLHSGHDLTDRDFEPSVGFCADSLEPGACFGFCLPFSAPSLLTFCLSLSPSKINIKKII